MKRFVRSIRGGGRAISRREFLHKTAVIGGAAAVGSLAGWPHPRASAVAPPFGVDLRTPGQPIDHVIVLMMENRSFDHYFGWLTGTNLRSYVANYPTASATSSDPRERHKAELQAAYGPATTNPFPTFHLSPDFRGCNPEGDHELQPYLDPDHSWDGGRDQMTNGFLSRNNDEFACGYYVESDVEFYARLARQFTLCDNYHCAVLGPTFPNREYMHSAWSGGLTTNLLPSQVPGHEFGFQWDTIWDLLDAAGVPWAYYFVDLPAIGLWGSRLLRGARHIEDFFADARAGTLPNVVFVDPGFTTGFRTDEHPYSDIRSGQAFSHNAVKAVIESPLWGRSVMFINYDEWGGFFDGVQTPPIVNDETRPLDGSLKPRTGSFGQLGFRVACLVVSPFAPKGALASEIAPPGRFYDHVSILKYVKDRFGLPSLTASHKARFPERFAAAPPTDRHDEAANIGELLLSAPDPARLDPAAIVEALPRPLVHSCPCPEEVLEGIAGQVSNAERAVTEPVDNSFDELASFLEQIGAPVNTPRSLHEVLCTVL